MNQVQKTPNGGRMVSVGVVDEAVVSSLTAELTELVQLGFGFLNFQLAVKQAFLLKYLKEYRSEIGRPLKILDLGGGNGPLCFLASRFGEVTNVDLFELPMWPTKNHIPLGQGHPDWPENCVHFVRAKFQDFAKETSSRYDVIVDSCSLIHFGEYGKQDMSEMLVENAELISSLLSSPAARFVSVSDVASDSSWEFKDFLYLGNLLTGLTSSKSLQLVESLNVQRVKKSMPKSYFLWWRNDAYEGRRPLYTIANMETGEVQATDVCDISPTIFHGFGRFGVVAPIAFVVLKKFESSSHATYPVPSFNPFRALKLVFHAGREFYRFQILELRILRFAPWFKVRE